MPGSPVATQLQCNEVLALGEEDVPRGPRMSGDWLVQFCFGHTVAELFVLGVRVAPPTLSQRMCYTMNPDDLEVKIWRSLMISRP